MAEIRSQALGADHVDVSSTQYKMALVYEEKQDFRRALPLCEESVSKAAKAMGPDHPEVQKRRLVYERLAHKAGA